MIRSKRSLNIAVLVVAGLAFSSLVPSAAFAETPDRSAANDSVSSVEDSSDPGELLELQAIDGGFSYQLPTESQEPGDGSAGGVSARSLGTGCQGQYLLRKVNNYIEWGASNSCTKTPAKQYLPWYLTGMLQRAKVGSSNYSTVHGPFSSGDRWGAYGNIASNFSCLGTTKYKYRVKWEVRYTGVWTGWWYSDTKEIACA